MNKKEEILNLKEKVEELNKSIGKLNIDFILDKIEKIQFSLYKIENPPKFSTGSIVKLSKNYLEGCTEQYQSEYNKEYKVIDFLYDKTPLYINKFYEIFDCISNKKLKIEECHLILVDKIIKN